MATYIAGFIILVHGFMCIICVIGALFLSAAAFSPPESQKEKWLVRLLMAYAAFLLINFAVISGYMVYVKL